MARLKKKLTLKTKLFLSILIVLIVLSAIGWRIFGGFITDINFQEYAPGEAMQQLPVKKITVITTYRGQYPAPAELDISLGDYSDVSEQKNNGQLFDVFSYKCGMKSEYDKCTVLSTQRGQQFTMDISPGSDSNFIDIKWLRGSTLLRFTWMGSPKKQPSVSELGSYIDSFKPYTFRGIPVEFQGGFPPPDVPRTDSIR